MAQGLKPLTLISSLSKEIRRCTGRNPRETLAFKHVMEEARKNQVTELRVCRGESEVVRVGDAFRCYLSSSRRRDHIQKEYHHGERTPEEAANLVGLTILPKVPFDNT